MLRLPTSLPMRSTIRYRGRPLRARGTAHIQGMSTSGDTGQRRIVAAGSGREGLGQAEVCDAIVGLARRPSPEVLYLGTATYDLPGPRAAQTSRLEELGCSVTALRLTSSTPPSDAIAEHFGRAEVILASGGNTLFAVDRWRRLGVDRLIREAMERGAVLCGGSAGAICWFDGGHSDSMNPSSYKRYMLASDPPALGERERSGWEYIRVPGLGILPGLCCPHHDRSQSNGVARSTDFRAMMLRHSGETGIAIDHFAALVVDGDDYRVISPKGRPGSLDGDGAAREGDGRPAVWRVTVVDGRVRSFPLPPEGTVDQALRPADTITDDPRLAAARAANPDDLP